MPITNAILSLVRHALRNMSYCRLSNMKYLVFIFIFLSCNRRIELAESNNSFYNINSSQRSKYYTGKYIELTYPNNYEKVYTFKNGILDTCAIIYDHKNRIDVIEYFFVYRKDTLLSIYKDSLNYIKNYVTTAIGYSYLETYFRRNGNKAFESKFTPCEFNWYQTYYYLLIRLFTTASYFDAK